jgi:sigma-B regulation protein RsbU (phosphoserine phosphatase)
MNQKRLHRMVETIASKHFDSEFEMLTTVLNQVIEDEQLKIIGARLWRLNTEIKGYKLLFQSGDVGKINPDFHLYLKDYPIFDLIAKERTILAKETNLVLRKKGIFKFSASGVGEKIKIEGKRYYEYLLALNSGQIDEEFRYKLNIIATVLTSRLKQKKTAASEKLLKADLDKARQLQKSILPEHEFVFHNYDLYGITLPAEIVGGDFFDYLPTGEDTDRLGVILGDAASKGVGAAAEAMYISGAIRMASTFDIKIGALMKRTNQLVNKIFSDDKFTSLFYGELSRDDNGLFLYANAGHNPPKFVRSNSDEIIQLNSTGPLLGPTPNAKYAVNSVLFNPGDVLVIYSDGVTEAANTEYEMFEDERLEQIILEKKHLTPKEITYAIIEAVIKFSARGKYNDDKTLVVIKRR